MYIAEKTARRVEPCPAHFATLQRNPSNGWRLGGQLVTVYATPVVYTYPDALRTSLYN